MTLIGIDFSLNSPALCALTGEDYTFISFFNYGGRPKDRPIPKAFKVHKELMELDAIAGISYNRQVKAGDFLLEERLKLTDARLIADMISTESAKQPDPLIAIEGFSYGSKGNSFLDMVAYNTVLRHALVEQCGIDRFHVFQPSAVKKIAGKGNANKFYMFEAFRDNKLKDPLLEKHALWQWCQGKEFEKEIPKPIDDLVDSYFIVRALSSFHNL